MSPDQINTLLKERDDVIEELKAELSSMKLKFDGVVRYVDGEIKKMAGAQNAIDNTAFAAFGMLTLDGKKFEMNTENVMIVREAMKANFGNFDSYRTNLMDEMQKRAAKEAKAAAKKAEVQAKRDAKKGRPAKKVEVTDGEDNSTEG